MKTVGKFIGEHRFQQDIRVDPRASTYLGAIADPGSDVDKFLVYGSSGLVGYRTGAEVLSDIGGLGSSATAAAAALLTTANLTSDATCFPMFTASATGNLPAYTNAALTFDSTNGALGASSLTTTGNITAVGTVHIDGTSGVASRLEMSEDTDNGTNFIRISAPASCATFGLTLPASDTAGAMVSDGAGTLSFSHLLDGNRKFAITADTDGTYRGDVVFFGGTTSMTVGTIYHYKSDGTWEAADADAAANCDGLLAVALGAASDTNGMLLRGMVTLDHDPGAVGDVLYLSTTAGDATATVPSGNTDIVRVIGYCLHASNGQIWFNPDNTFVQVTA